MKTITGIIIDDKNVNIETLQQLLEQFCPSVKVVGVANNVEDAFVLINQRKPQLIFLDIELNGSSGFDLLHMFKNVFFKTIFTTAYSQYAIDAFREKATDYLLKPINIRHLQEAIAKVEEEIQQEEIRSVPGENVMLQQKISVPTMEGFLFLDHNEILHCEAAGSYSNFHLSGGKKIMVSMRLKECERILPSAIFYRIHNSHIVNVNHVNRYIRGKVGQVILSSNAVVEVAVARKDDFLKFMKGK